MRVESSVVLLNVDKSGVLTLRGRERDGGERRERERERERKGREGEREMSERTQQNKYK